MPQYSETDRRRHAQESLARAIEVLEEARASGEDRLVQVRLHVEQGEQSGFTVSANLPGERTGTGSHEGYTGERRISIEIYVPPDLERDYPRIGPLEEVPHD